MAGGGSSSSRPALDDMSWVTHWEGSGTVRRCRRRDLIPEEELERQVRVYVDLGFPARAGLPPHRRRHRGPVPRHDPGGRRAGRPRAGTAPAPAPGRTSGSRRSGSPQRRPKLGWCWDRNPHTWLSTASAAAALPARP